MLGREDSGDQPMLVMGVSSNYGSVERGEYDDTVLQVAQVRGDGDVKSDSDVRFFVTM